MTLHAVSFVDHTGTFDDPLAEARRVFRQQADAIAQLASRVDERFTAAVEMIRAARGRIVVAGIGKSGLVARKIASTLSCTGTPAFFLHPVDAAHGDLGALIRGDVAILVSNSGETAELTELLPYLREHGIPVIALVGKLDSALAQRADLALDIRGGSEACPHDLVPTTSVLTTLAMGDALALTIMQRRHFDAHDFARLHPGGSLGRRLQHVGDHMRTDQLPRVAPGQSQAEALLAMSRARSSIVAIVDGDGRIVGTVSQAALAESLDGGPTALQNPVLSVLGPRWAVISEAASLSDAVGVMRTLGTDALIVVDSKQKPIGVIDLPDGA